MTRAYNRLSDNDKHFWRIDISDRSTYTRTFGGYLESGDEEYRGCAVILNGFGYMVRVRLPNILKPYSREVQFSASMHGLSGGATSYIEKFPRRYGISLSEGGFLQVYLGPQTHDSTTTQNYCHHLGFTQWRHCRSSLYDLEGKHFWTEPEGKWKPDFRNFWTIRTAINDVVPKAKFLINDYDGTPIVVETKIEEREYKFGDGWFKWLSLFRKNRIYRSLDISFAKECGPEKGSWKGGLMGTGIEMLPGELHEDAFRRYCGKEQRAKYGNYKITFVGRVEEPKPVEDPNVGASEVKCNKQ